MFDYETYAEEQNRAAIRHATPPQEMSGDGVIHKQDDGFTDGERRNLVLSHGLSGLTYALLDVAQAIRNHSRRE